jgi:hypothetical protein
MALQIEQAKNLASSTTTGSVNNSSNPVTFSVQSGDGASFPSTTNGPFRVVLSATDGTNAEVMLCTSRSTDSFTCSRGSSATGELPVPTLLAQSSGALVSHIITVGGMEHLLTERRPRLTAPDSSAFSWVNQNGAVEDHDDYGFTLRLPNTGGNSLTHRVVSVTSPYTLVCGFRGLTVDANFNQCGPSIHDGVNNKSIVCRFKNDGTFDIYTWNDPASFQSQLYSTTLGPAFWGLDLIMVKIVVDASHRTYYIATLRGGLRGSWIQLFQHANNAFITEDHAGVFCLASNGSDQMIDVDHWVIS